MSSSNNDQDEVTWNQVEDAEQLLGSALAFLEAGQPIPLHWAVANATEFPNAWALARAPSLVAKIAAHSVPQEELVRALVAIVQPVLRLIVQDYGAAKLAIETAEDWASRRASQAAAQFAGEVAKDAGQHEPSPSFDAFQAAAYAAFAAATSDDDMELGDLADACAHAVAAAETSANERNEIVHGHAYLRRIAMNLAKVTDNLRRQLAHRDILTDLVNANRGIP